MASGALPKKTEMQPLLARTGPNEITSALVTETCAKVPRLMLVGWVNNIQGAKTSAGRETSPPTRLPRHPAGAAIIISRHLDSRSKTRLIATP